MTATTARVMSRGFTLIELMTAITLFAILSLLAMPMYSAFMANTQIRTASESMLAGLRLAQTEALRRNVNVEFLLDETKGWKVNDVSDIDNVEPINHGEFKVGASNTKVTPTGDSRRVTFNGVGRVLRSNPVGNTAPLNRIDVTTTFDNMASTSRNLRVLIDGASADGKTYSAGVRLCDPGLPDTDPAGCPP